ncbi:MAG: NADH-quinone oxidoreductase subunit NuoE [Propionibacteriaceae bacterium]|jgi:NADH-quinone oxidoreductase subunit E|nr:NADH-quinone oxidoreductase subunit NuoE [Propionibacteriaceae bacterium]
MSEHEFESYFGDTGSVDMSDRSSAIDKAAIDQLTAIAERYPQKRSALMPMLHLVQSIDGRVSPRGVEVCAEILGITPAQVSGVATFYTMYKRRPAGKHHIGVCTTALCAVMGGDALLDHVERKLGIHPEETTADGMFSLERVECNAACDFAPVMMVNWEFMDNMTPERADQLLDDLAAGREVRSTRGPVITSWSDNEKVLAGEDDGLADEGPSAGEPSLAGVHIAAERGWKGVPTASLASAATAPTPVKSPDPTDAGGVKETVVEATEPVVEAAQPQVEAIPAEPVKAPTKAAAPKSGTTAKPATTRAAATVKSTATPKAAETAKPAATTRPASATKPAATAKSGTAKPATTKSATAKPATAKSGTAKPATTSKTATAKPAEPDTPKPAAATTKDPAPSEEPIATTAESDAVETKKKPATRRTRRTK